MTEMPGTQHEGTTTQRLDRLEAKVDIIAEELAELKRTGGERRGIDEARIRHLEDSMLVWDTRWRTLTALLVGVFGSSILAAAAAIVGIVR